MGRTQKYGHIVMRHGTANIVIQNLAFTVPKAAYTEAQNPTITLSLLSVKTVTLSA